VVRAVVTALVAGAAVVADVLTAAAPLSLPLLHETRTTPVLRSSAANERDDVVIDFLFISGSPCLETRQRSAIA
jgi:hypothetical protein